LVPEVPYHLYLRHCQLHLEPHLDPDYLQAHWVREVQEILDCRKDPADLAILERLVVQKGLVNRLDLPRQEILVLRRNLIDQGNQLVLSDLAVLQVQGHLAVLVLHWVQVILKFLELRSVPEVLGNQIDHWDLKTQCCLCFQRSQQFQELHWIRLNQGVLVHLAVQEHLYYQQVLVFRRLH